MNKEWSEKNKHMQSLLKRNTFSEGIASLIELRDILMREIDSFKSLSKEDFSAMPFPNADGYHSKTVAYSIWHIFRIEDIVVNSLIRKEKEVLFSESFDKKTNSPIITTGNELTGLEIARFSSSLDIDALYEYINAVKSSTDIWLKTISYDMLKIKFDDSDKERLKALGVVADCEEASWLIDYWCGKDIAGLIKMPLSRHWIMHIEASDRIITKIKKDKK